MAKPELGSKRQCQNCGAKFFDLNRDPILCPKCGATFQPPAVSRSAARAAAAEDEETELPESAAEMVPLEEADASEDKVAATVDDEVDLGDDAGDDDTFLEEEEEDNDDVSDLIDSDIETDEEG
ncbi:TIGR02300 family protein [Rhodoblastus acidophilus]|uniref:TIGR02300 family protein n=1 Tax=Candidatus Rhodoblastus alkanivorans TaxID=2954117 RepID=A0ABS9Z195_9HYPH|nr:TIGR02300 family protein [Candidatus Rhodoblastus alkanivorans]MCI4681430.1 TIGR02300 family protein [Candidatus Rhodoblastus alkanivorans]MDI4642478.1 TIGR02300 family protein [Rhodoblastus acidophilus]